MAEFEMSFSEQFQSGKCQKQEYLTAKDF